MNPNKKRTKKKQHGGKKLGQGSYGCVITPPVKCKHKFRGNKYKVNKDFVSKIINYKKHKSAFNELEIGDKLMKIDPDHMYFLPFINGCFFVPQKHPNIIYQKDNFEFESDPTEIPSSFDDEVVSVTTSSLSSSDKVTHKRKKVKLLKTTDTKTNQKLLKQVKKLKSRCQLSSHQTYLNLIGPFISQSLGHLYSEPGTSNKIIYFKLHYDKIFHYLLKGLEKLHKNKIIHKDIKPGNIGITFTDYNKKSTKSSDILGDIEGFRVGYIDFGHSTELHKMRYSGADLRELLSGGTQYYKPSEIYILKTIYYMVHKGYDLSSKDVYDTIFKIDKKIYNQNKTYYNCLGLSSKKMYSKSLFKNNIKWIYELYKSDDIVNEFIHNDLIYLWDVFALGMTFAKTMSKLNIRDHDLEKIVNHMIEINPLERWSLRKILKDSYWT